jgi:uncharacterized membrane protein
MAGLAVLAVAAGLLGPAGPIGRTVPPGTPGTEFNVSLLAEARVALALAGLLLAAIAWLPRPLVALAERLTPPLLRLDDWLRAGQRWSILLALAILVAAAVLAAYSIARHNAFNSKAYDLGLHAQVWWNTSQGRPFAGSVEVDNYLGDHVSPIILPLAPLYSLWPDARLLLLLQAAALAVGAWPLALLARRRLRPHWPQGAHLAALLLAAIYLTYPALGFVNRFEFHEEVFAVPLLLLAFWALEARRLAVMSLALLLALLTKEDVGLTVAAFGLWAWWRGREGSRMGTDEHGSEETPVTLSGSGAPPAPAHDASEESPSSGSQRLTDPLTAGRRFTEPARAANAERRLQAAGLLWATIGVTWSLITLFVIIPFFRGAESDTLARYAWLGSGPFDILSGAIQNPGRIAGHLLGEPRRLWMLVKFLLPVGFLPLLSPAILIALPSLAVNWLAGNLYQASIYAHYATLMIPVVFAAAVYGMERVAVSGVRCQVSGVRFHVSRFTLTLLGLAACALLAMGFDQFWQARPGPDDWENYGLARQVDEAAFRKAAALLPAGGAVATTEAYAPHLANRQGLYLLHDPRILFAVDRVDWVLVDLNDHRYGVQPRQYYGLLRWVADVRGLGVCHFAGDVALLGPGCNDPLAGPSFLARLAELQAEAAGDQVNPVLLDFVGAEYFQP